MGKPMSNPTTMSEAPAHTGRRRAANSPAAAARDAAVTRDRGSAVRFYVCLGVLVVAAASMQTVAGLLGQYFRKQPVPLKKPLYRMDKSKLAPEYTLFYLPAPNLSEDVLQSLGTHEYILWRLEDQTRSSAAPPSIARLFITYFTGQPDMVPHVPDECYLAGGYDPVGTPETIDVFVPRAGAPQDKIPVRVLTFQTPQRGGLGRLQLLTNAPETVMYFFHTNGSYATTRNQVRVSQANLWDRYAYYAKIQVSCSNRNREESIAALAPLLRKVMPILLNDHFQDWEALTAEGREPPTGG